MLIGFRRAHSLLLGNVRFYGRGGGPGLWMGGWGGGGPGLWMGGSLVNSLQIEEGHSFFGKEKITPFRFYFVYSKATSQD